MDTSMPPAPGSTNGRPPRPSLAWIVVALFIVAVFHPGIMSNDSLASLKQARSFEFTDWHPPIMALVWAPLDRIIAGPAGMLVLQALLYAYGAAKLCASAFPRLSKRLPPWLLVLVFSLFPPVMTLTGMIWKDVWTSGFLLLALAHLFLLRDSATRAQRIRHSVVIVLCCLVATAFRHNAMAATAGLLAGMVFLNLPRAGTWLRLAIACTSGVLVSIALFLGITLLHGLVAKPAHPTTAIYLYDMAGIIVYSGDAEAAAEQLLAHPVEFTDNRDLFLRRVYQRYSPAVAGNVLRSTTRPNSPFSLNVYREHDAAGVREAHRNLIRTYPVAYLKHRTTVFSCLLQMCDRKEWINHSYVLNPRYALPDTMDPGSLQYKLRRIVLSGRLAPIYHPGFWLLVTLAGGIAGFISLFRARGRAPSLLLFMGLSSVGLAFSLYFTSPIESFRYMHWSMLLGWTTLFLGVESVLGADSGENRAADAET